MLGDSGVAVLGGEGVETAKAEGTVVCWRVASVVEGGSVRVSTVGGL